MTDFKPTHRLTFRPGGGGPTRTFEVMLDDEGRAYSKFEWDAVEHAGVTYDAEDGWRFLGQVTPGGENGNVEVVDLRNPTWGYAPGRAPANGAAQGCLVQRGDDGGWRFGSTHGGGPYTGPVFETEDQARAEACHLFGAEMVPNRYPRGAERAPRRPTPIVVVE